MKRTHALEYLLGNIGIKVIPKWLSADSDLIYGSSYFNEIEHIYRALGGMLKVFPNNFTRFDLYIFDLESGDKLIIELDEDLHFNRYRKLTLNSPFYKVYTKFPLNEYLQYCEERESRCLKAGSYGGKWSSVSAIRQFGNEGSKGILEGHGSPRWKQRAFYDFLKDVYSHENNIRLVRFAIWDHFIINGKHILLDDILRGRMQYREIFSGLRHLINRRM